MNNVSPPIAIHCENLTKSFHDGDIHVNVLENLDLSVAEGEMVSVIGTSGAGKSTLLHLLGGLDKPTDGKVYIAGNDVTILSEKAKGKLRNRYLGFVYQFHHLLPEFTAIENICMPLLIRGLKPKEALEKAIAYIEKVGLIERRKHRVGELSGGERQRIAVARALVTEPKCVLADEPTGNLDNKTAGAVLDLMLRLNKELKTSFIVVTHNEQLASRLDRTLILKEGSLHEQV